MYYLELQWKNCAIKNNWKLNEQSIDITIKKIDISGLL